MNSPSGTRAVIIGTGRAGARLHCGALRAAGAEVRAFVDIDPQQGQQVARQYEVPAVYGSLEEAIDKERPQIVSVCSSPESHYGLASVALNSGCHVIVEKPLTATLAEALQLRELSEKTGKSVCTIHNFRFLPGFLKVVEMLQSGVIGEVIHFSRYMTFFHETVRMMEPGHWAHQIPGGRLFEANPHNLYLAYQFAKSMKLLHIEGRPSIRWPHAGVDGFSALLRGQTGATVEITMSLNLNATPNQRFWPEYMMLIGTNASLFFDYKDVYFLNQIKNPPPPGLGACAKAGIRKIRSLAHAVKKRLAGGPKAAAAPAFAYEGAGTGHNTLIERYVGYVEGRYPEPPVSWDEAIEVLSLNEEMGKVLEANLKAQAA